MIQSLNTTTFKLLKMSKRGIIWMFYSNQKTSVGNKYKNLNFIDINIFLFFNN